MTTMDLSPTLGGMLDKFRRNIRFAEKREDWLSVCKIVRRASLDLRKAGLRDEAIFTEFRRAAENALWEQDRVEFAAAWKKHALRQQQIHGTNPIDAALD